MTIDKHSPHQAIYSSIQTKKNSVSENTGRFVCFLIGTSTEIVNFLEPKQEKPCPMRSRTIAFLSNKQNHSFGCSIQNSFWCSILSKIILSGVQMANALRLLQVNRKFWLDYYGGRSFALLLRCAVLCSAFWTEFQGGEKENKRPKRPFC